jgi:hypothetical protein
MSLNPWAAFPTPIAYCRLKFSAGAPVYGGTAGAPQAAGIFNTAVAPVDNGAGDTTFALTRDLSVGAGVELVQVIVAWRGAVAASQLKTYGWVLGASTLRLTTLQEGAAGAVSALTDEECDVFVFLFPSVPPI